MKTLRIGTYLKRFPPGPLESVVRWARTEESSESPDKWLGTRITN